MVYIIVFVCYSIFWDKKFHIIAFYMNSASVSPQGHLERMDRYHCPYHSA